MFVVFYKYIFVKLVLKFIILFFIYFKYIDIYILGFLNRVMIKKILILFSWGKIYVYRFWFLYFIWFKVSIEF